LYKGAQLLKKKILVSAGDPSGDLKLSRLIQALQEKFGPDAFEFFGLAGPECEKRGVRLVARSSEVAVMGFTEVLAKLPKILSVLKKMNDELPAADGVLLVDFPDFNFKLAHRASQLKKPVDYFIAPQIWVWKRGRLKAMQKFVRRVYPELPFEENIYREAGIGAHYYGHPIRDILPPKARKAVRQELNIHQEDFLFAILPGSRHSEIRKHLPIFVDAWHELRIELSRRRDDRVVRVVLPLAQGITEKDFLDSLNEEQKRKYRTWVDYREWIVGEDSWKMLQAADFGWIASGTASLEAGYYQLPHILVYKLSALTALLIKMRSNYLAVDGGFAGLPNIILEKAVVPELLQADLDSKRLRSETIELLYDHSRLQAMRKELRWLPKKMGSAGVLERIAEDYGSLWSS
jgi:lipid-A-disaccharide synthase